MTKVIANYWFQNLPEYLITDQQVFKMKPITLTLPDSTVKIYIPEPKDKNKGLTPGGKFQYRSESFMMDIETDIENDEELKKLDKTAQDIAYKYLRLLRVKLSSTPMPLPERLNFIVLYKWDGSPPAVSNSRGHSSPFNVYMLSKDAGLTKDKWEELQRELSLGADTELWEDFMLDSKVAVLEDNFNQATIYAAIACEIFIKNHTEKIAVKRGLSKTFWKYIGSQEPDIRAIRYYGPILHLVTGHSLEDEKKELYKSLEHLFKERNRVMHKGKRSFSADERSKLIEEFVKARKAISWVQNLE